MAGCGEPERREKAGMPPRYHRVFSDALWGLGMAFFAA